MTPSAHHRSAILRFATAGSVDDGKSSLIGRLLYDTKSIFEDQLAAIEKASERRGSSQVELALLTDGLRAEREQNITIDVAYRYFSTPKRKFIIADTPGHVQYTRNMVTGASTADLAVILIDARKGVVTQSKRHAAISVLLGIRHLVLAVNKMDLVEYSEQIFQQITSEFAGFARRLGVEDVTCIPISALLGDNIVNASPNMPWYSGPSLLRHLEDVVVEPADQGAFRLPIQYVIRPDQDFRGFAGRVAGGSVRVGDTVTVLPSKISALVSKVLGPDGECESADLGESIVVCLDHEVDVSRGDMLVSAHAAPTIAREFDATICWMHEEPLGLRRRYLLMHTTRRVIAYADRIEHKIDVDSWSEQPASSLGLNEIGRVRIVTASPIFFDPYACSPRTGSFVIVDESTLVTVGAGMIHGSVAPSIGEEATEEKLSGLVWVPARDDDYAAALESLARARGAECIVFRERDLWKGLGDDLWNNDDGARELRRRVREFAKVVSRQGILTICAVTRAPRDIEMKAKEFAAAWHEGPVDLENLEQVLDELSESAKL